MTRAFSSRTKRESFLFTSGFPLFSFHKSANASILLIFIPYISSFFALLIITQHENKSETHPEFHLQSSEQYNTNSSLSLLRGEWGSTY